MHNMDGSRRLPEQGAVEDFRLLADFRDRWGTTALVGSRAGFVLCTPASPRTAYGPQDQVLGQEKDVAFGPLGRGGD
ncbi:hypothetical protein ACWCSD_06895 [Nonomuraea sp. NPDC001684]